MGKKFSRIYKTALKPQNLIPLDYKNDRIVLFSDHHKGDGSPADDFKKNASLYDFALTYYKKEKYKLIVLGDNEELWENRYDQVLENYNSLLRNEIDMALESTDNKKIRLWGNHDKEVSLRRFKRFCKNSDLKMLKAVEYREGLCLGKKFFLIHGHQGRFFEDRAWRISRWAVHFIWKTLQQLFNIGIDGPAENFKIRDNLEMNYYKWAKKNKILLICGHTHRAIFGSMTHWDLLQKEIHDLEKKLSVSSQVEDDKIKKEIEKKKKQMEKIMKSRSGNAPISFESPPTNPIPCYFNDGCCGYTNGITCLEIDKSFIRLIKWQRLGKKRTVLVEKDLPSLLEHIKENKPLEQVNTE